jgi:hypothetical protein
VFSLTKLRAPSDPQRQPFEGVIVMSDIVVCDFAYGREDSGAFLLLTSPKPE